MKGNYSIQVRTKQFFELAVAKYGTKFDYSLVDYQNNSTKVNIICPDHGLFAQLPNNHLSSKEGCYQCGKNRAGLNHRMTLDEFIVRANRIHSNQYNYTKTEYIGAFDQVVITCDTHGDFTQVPNDHLYGMNGCKRCGYERNVSRGEAAIQAWLTTNGILFEQEKRFDGLVGLRGHPLRYDFYLPTRNTIIEFDGPHHTKPLRYKGSSEASALKTHQLTKLYDQRKDDFVKEKGMHIIRIPYDQLKNIAAVLASFVPCYE